MKSTYLVAICSKDGGCHSPTPKEGRVSVSTAISTLSPSVPAASSRPLALSTKYTRPDGMSRRKRGRRVSVDARDCSLGRSTPPRCRQRRLNRSLSLLRLSCGLLPLVGWLGVPPRRVAWRAWRSDVERLACVTANDDSPGPDDALEEGGGGRGWGGRFVVVIFEETCEEKAIKLYKLLSLERPLQHNVMRGLRARGQLTGARLVSSGFGFL